MPEYHLRDNLCKMLKVIYFTISFFALNIRCKDTLFLMNTTSPFLALYFLSKHPGGNDISTTDFDYLNNLITKSC